MTVTDKDAQRRPWCMFGDIYEGGVLWADHARLVHVGQKDCWWGKEVQAVTLYMTEYGTRYTQCRELTPEELANRGLTQPPRPWAERVTQWARDRNIIPGSTADRQFLKLVEEVGELSTALQKKDRKRIMDAIGDIAVTANNIAELSEMTFDECLEAAWEEIKDRTGKLVNGVFVKEVSE